MTDGQKLVAFYVDECIEQGAPEMVKMKGHVARRAKELLEYDSVDHVRATLREFVRRRCRTPLQLAELSTELERNESANVAERPEARRLAQQWIKENGWPTGATFKRGTHAGSYVYDPLGTEPIPIGYAWPYQRPTFDDVVEALHA
jgi:hypothetical protein